MSEQLSSKIVKTRKPHQCFGCLIEIKAGSKAEYTTCKDGGELYSAYWCMNCVEFLNEIHDSGEEVYEGSVPELRRCYGDET